MTDKVATNYDLVDFSISKQPDPMQSKYITMCVKLAAKSPLTHKHGCVIVDKKSGDIISKGFNKRLNNHVHVKSMHAEIAAIKNAKKHFLMDMECDMYIVRIGKEDGLLKYSKPCPQCSGVIKSHTRIRNIYYSINSL
jgi:tRNA(Arg) A34 adenosine deaminase TadA